MNIVHWRAVAVALAISWWGSALAGGPLSVTFTVDENCNGTVAQLGVSLTLPCFSASAEGGIAYELPQNGIFPQTGSLVMNEPGGSTPSDLIEFMPGGFIFFFSDSSGGVDALADFTAEPRIFFPTVTVTEVGPEGNNGFTYTPTAGQPGFFSQFGSPATYIIHSDPEPATLALLGIGLAGLGFSRRRKQ